MPYQCSGGLTENMCGTSEGLDLFLEWKSRKNQIEMWLDSHTANFKDDVSNRKSYNDVENGWGCGDKRTVIKKESFNTEWVTSVKLLKCTQSKINDENKDNALAVC